MNEDIFETQVKELQLDRLIEIMSRLRSEGGCPWDIEQTHESLIPYIIEEAFEVVDAIREGDSMHLKEELGDLLLQVVFHSQIADEKGVFDFDEVAREVSDKMIRRHPHVFGEAIAANPNEVLSQWEQIKRKEKGGPCDSLYLKGVAKGLPPLLAAMKLQKKAAKVGFDWPSSKEVIDKIKEEIVEVEDELALKTAVDSREAKLIDEVGDLFFAVVNLARSLGVNPEEALQSTNSKFEKRFNQLEVSLEAQGVSLKEATLEQMELEWQKAKLYQ